MTKSIKDVAVNAEMNGNWAGPDPTTKVEFTTLVSFHRLTLKDRYCINYNIEFNFIIYLKFGWIIIGRPFNCQRYGQSFWLFCFPFVSKTNGKRIGDAGMSGSLSTWIDWNAGTRRR